MKSENTKLDMKNKSPFSNGKTNSLSEIATDVSKMNFAEIEQQLLKEASKHATNAAQFIKKNWKLVGPAFAVIAAAAMVAHRKSKKSSAAKTVKDGLKKKAKKLKSLRKK